MTREEFATLLSDFTSSAESGDGARFARNFAEDGIYYDYIYGPHKGRADIAHMMQDLFHRDAESGLSCASCHPDGSDDGHVWQFSGQGMRRTQPVDVSLAGTAPFHWDGSLREVKDLMGEVFVNRMGGVHQSAERLTAWSPSSSYGRCPGPRRPAAAW